jgi:hypothetical protein
MSWWTLPDRPKNVAPTIIGPTLAGLTLAGYSRPLPLAYGTVRCPSIVVLYRDRAADSVHIRSQVGAAAWVLAQGNVAAAIFALCEAPAHSIIRVWSDREKFELDTLSDFTGTDTDPLFGTANGVAVIAETSTAWTYLVGKPAEGQTFEGTVHVYSQKWTLRDGKIPAMSFEVESLCTGSTPWTVDADPSEVVKDMLTHARRGLGLAAADVDVVYGPDGTADSGFARYCKAMSLGVSRLIDERTPTMELLEELLQACNSTLVWSEGKAKVVPLDTQIRTGNSVTYTPPNQVTPTPTQPVVLDEDELLFEPGTDPVRVRSTLDADVFNAWPVKFRSRESDYNEVTTEWIEPADAAVRGVRRAATTENRWISTQAHAHKLSTWLAQRSIYSRNRYSFTVGPRWALLEVGDLVALTESKLGLSAVQARISLIEDNPDGTRNIEAIEEPTGTSAVVDLTPQTDDGYNTAALVMAESSIIDHVPRIYRQDAQPTGFAVGDLWYDTNDGNKLYRYNGSTWDATTVGSGAITSSAVDIGKLTTSLYDRDNLFPNPTSEIAPPDGADLSSPEWADRYYAGAGAYSGSYVRRIAAGGSDTGNGIWIPCSPGARFYVEAMVRRTSGSGSGGTVGVNFYTTLGDTGSYLASHQAPNVTSSSWTKTSIVSAVAGTTANAALLYWFARANDTVEFDALYARRVVTNPVIGTAVVSQANLTATTSTNLWPNGDSETEPPTGATDDVLNSAEFKYRATAAAYGGTTYGRSVPNGESLSVEYPVAPGSLVRFRGFLKSSGAGATPKIAISFYDSSSWTEVTSYSTTSTNWIFPATGSELYALVPAGTACVRFTISASAGTGYFDQLDADITPYSSVISASKNSTSWTAVGGASWWIKSSSHAIVTCTIAYQNAATSAVCFRLNGPTGMIPICRWQLTQANLPGGEIVEWTTTLAAATSSLTLGVETQIVFLDLKAYVAMASTSGVVQLEWAGSGSGTVSVLRGVCHVGSEP